MKDIPPYKERGKPVQPRPPRIPKDRYDLLTMEPGSHRFWYGKTQNQLSPYTSYAKKKGWGRWRLEKDTLDGRSGVRVVCVENTSRNGASSRPFGDTGSAGTGGAHE